MYAHERRWLRKLAIANDYVRVPYANGRATRRSSSIESCQRGGTR